ncbi:DUF2220 family protein [Chitinispirillales bacterium ANBcel5]|uniref:Wadjet anti-phage system protein JetD domain-containing protein n=1 Tax=Cellulosispirillum alkaliphilum TaxID=3039283 RepID=UPI002A57D05A|nr:DUF2220 family protein [Chitinispirillales bacterium ANBcel5]
MNKSKVNRWTTTDDIKNLLLRKWKKGDFLRETLKPTITFPMEIALKFPKGKSLSDNFGPAMEWAKMYRTTTVAQLPYTVVWSEFNFREVGRNTIPVAVQFENIENITKFLNKNRLSTVFKDASQKLLTALPKLESWVYSRPFCLLELAPVLDRLIAVVEWILRHPRPGIYIRQISIHRVDTKFIEKHKKVLGEWLDLILDSSQIYTLYSGTRYFEPRYGFLSKQPLIRFRILDSDLCINGLSDMALPADQFCRLNIDAEHVFVTENDINGLCFPSVKGAIVIFGRGYGFDYLENAQWLKQKAIWYWGDIDTHGFAILNQFRVFFPQAQSFLMDRDTLLAHRDHWVEEKVPSNARLDNLSKQETSLYEELVEDQLGKAVRLEQELVQFECVKRGLEKLVHTPISLG